MAPREVPHRRPRSRRGSIQRAGGRPPTSTRRPEPATTGASARPKPRPGSMSACCWPPSSTRRTRSPPRRSRTAKVQALVTLLRDLASDEIEAAVGFLVGAPRQGRIGVGWRTAFAVDVAPAAGPSITIRRARRRADRARRHDWRRVGRCPPGACSATCSGGRRSREVDFVRRLLTGELRQGALAGRDDRRGRQGERCPRRGGAASGDAHRRPRVARRFSPSRRANAALEAVRLTVLHPIEPMLASSATDVADALAKTGPASVEWKLDGVRVQVHRHGDGGAHLHAEPQRHHRTGCPAWWPSPKPCPQRRWCSTARCSAWPRTSGPVPSRTR